MRTTLLPKILRVIPLLYLASALAAVEPDAASKPDASAIAQAEDRILQADLGRINTFVQLMGQMETEMAVLQASVKLKTNGYYTSDEHDAIERLMFRYLVCRESLWDMIEFYRDHETRFTSPERRAKGFVIGYSAALHLYYFSSKLIATFLDEPIVIKKLNEDYHRSEIPANTYENVFKGITDPKNIQDIAAAWEIYSREFKDPNSPLSHLAETDPAYKKLILNIQWAHEQGEKQRDDVLERSALFSPKIRNALRHAEVTQVAEGALGTAGNAFAAIRALTFTNVSRLKKPGSPPLEFAPGQVAEMKQTLQPGDVILTYSAGYMSNVFLPGVFKHGITYVGSPEDRRGAGLIAAPEELLPTKREDFMEALALAKLDDGTDADLIEAVAEGVVFNSLHRLAGTKINRMVALRPAITPQERTESLSNLFVFLGDRYDFDFDFNDASALCCTELIYRCLNKRSSIELTLVKRMGRQTLSADDICHATLKPGTMTFEPILLVVEDGRESTRADIVIGKDARPALEKLMRTAGTE